DAKSAPNPVYQTLAGQTRSLFKGYETTNVSDSKVVLLIKGDAVLALTEGDEGEVVLDHTPFYAESGGQVGDVGVLTKDETVANVLDTYSPVQGLIVHKVRVQKGSLMVGDVVA